MLCRIYENIYGNCVKKDINFQRVVEQVFGHKKLAELIVLVHEETVNVANAKQIMMRVIDGDERMPSVIAAEFGLTGKVELSQELLQQCKDVVAKNPSAVKKVIKKNKQGPLMHLVGQIMKQNNNRADPVFVKHLLNEEIKKIKLDPTEITSDEDD